ncbi:MAG: hypothetical protein F6K30_30385, partial [Cyanothece sp. SIO2G6]|nr:hypothetical protein [Cyanothece sp. SIO2G6]
ITPHIDGRFHRRETCHRFMLGPANQHATAGRFGLCQPFGQISGDETKCGLKMIDGGDRDEKILCVPAKDPRYTEVKTLQDIAPHRLDEIAEFFRTYKNLEKKVTEIGDWKGLEAVNPLIEKCIKAANE